MGVWLLALLLLATSCDQPSVRRVSLRQVDPTLASPARGGDEPPSLRIAAAPVVSPSETLRSYGTLFDYLGRKLGRPIQLVQRRTYAETYELLRTGSVDFALVCTYVYVLGRQEFGLEPVAAPVVHGQPAYQSVLIVRAEASFQSFADLKGRRFAFTDPLSTSGFVYPVSLLRELGTAPEGFFGSVIYTHSHDHSIRAVAEGVVDGAAVDSLVWDQWRARHPERAAALREIGRSPVFASPPFVARPGVSSHLLERFRLALLEMHRDAEGRRILAELGIDRFALLPDAAYQSVRDLGRRAGTLPGGCRRPAFAPRCSASLWAWRCWWAPRPFGWPVRRS